SPPRPATSKAGDERSGSSPTAVAVPAVADPNDGGAGDPEATTASKSKKASGTRGNTKKVAVAAVPAPTGPVLGSSDAQKSLEPAVLECMRAQKVHDLLAYMGNSKVGAVKVLGDSRSRVDGVRAKVQGTALGKCMDKAGASLRVRA